MRKRFASLVFIMMCVCYSNLWAGPAAPIEIELEQPFMDRVVFPVAKKVGEIALRFTPQNALNETSIKCSNCFSLIGGTSLMTKYSLPARPPPNPITRE